MLHFPGLVVLQAASDMPIDARCRLLGMSPTGVAVAPTVDVLPVVGSLGMALELQPVTVRLPALPVVQVNTAMNSFVFVEQNSFVFVGTGTASTL